MTVTMSAFLKRRAFTLRMNESLSASAVSSGSTARPFRLSEYCDAPVESGL